MYQMEVIRADGSKGDPIQSDDKRDFYFGHSSVGDFVSIYFGIVDASGSFVKEYLEDYWEEEVEVFA